MADPDKLKRKKRVRIIIRYSCTTNDINDPNYFEDYLEEKWIWK